MDDRGRYFIFPSR